MLTGKNKRVTTDEKEKLKIEYQKKRDRYEHKNLGGFSQIFPVLKNHNEGCFGLEKHCFIKGAAMPI
jgi:hypothetical protein